MRIYLVKGCNNMLYCLTFGSSVLGDRIHIPGIGPELDAEHKLSEWFPDIVKIFLVVNQCPIKIKPSIF
tara:strand:+ start:625 stop:831 length:207 start_codon:yes stop_codon:yes gene_type:complete